MTDTPIAFNTWVVQPAREASPAHGKSKMSATVTSPQPFPAHPVLSSTESRALLSAYPPRLAPLCLLIVALAIPSTPAQAIPDLPTRRLLALANADRARFHLPPLAWDPALALAAQAHAARVIHEPAIEHQYPAEPDLLHRAAAAGARLSVISENLLRGDAALLTSTGGAALVEQTWMSTPTHRANLLDPRLNAAGISLLRAGNTLVVVEDLAQTSPGSVTLNGLAATEQAVVADLLARGLPQAAVTDAARAACTSPAAPGVTTPVLTIAWDGPDPSVLPAALLTQLPGHTRAEVAACPGVATAQGFTTTRVTVLLP